MVILNRQQNYQKSCGAVCLLCAVKELWGGAIHNYPADAEFRANDRNQRIGCDLADEVAIYWVTGETKNKSHVQPDHWGDNMPYALVKCAELLGFKSKVVTNFTFSVGGMHLKYPIEVAKLVRHCKLKYNAPKYLKPIPGWIWKNRKNRYKKYSTGGVRILKLMIHNNGLHYVLYRPDSNTNEYMDPTFGSNFADRNLLVQSYGTQGLWIHGTGLDVVIKV